MKILFVSSLYHPYAVGGAEVTVKLLAEGLVRRGDEAVVVTLTPSRTPAEQTVEGVRIHYVPLFNVYFPRGPERHPIWQKAVWHTLEAFNPVMARRLGAIVDREKPDVVNVHNMQGFTAAIWPLLAKRQLPIVQTLHDHYTVCVNSVMYRRQRNCVGRCLHCRVLGAARVRLSRRVDVVTAVSERLWQRLAGFGAFRSVPAVKIINGCNTEEVAPGAERAGPPPGGTLRLGFLGRLEPIKGLEGLLQAAEAIGPAHLTVAVGGTGLADYEAGLRARFSGPVTTFLGRVTPRSFFAEIDVLVVPSLVEDSLPRVVHESLGFGVPVIGAAIGGIPEMIREGVTGFLVPPGDIAALERRLRELQKDPPDWKTMSSNCLQEAGRFAYGRIFSEYQSVWAAASAAHTARALPVEALKPRGQIDDVLGRS